MKYIHVSFRGTVKHGIRILEGDSFFQINGNGNVGIIAELRAKCRQQLELGGETLENSPTILCISELSEELYKMLIGKEATNSNPKS